MDLARSAPRDLFDLPRAEAYFRMASIAPALRASTDALREQVGRLSAPWTVVAQGGYRVDLEPLRGMAGGLFGATSDDMGIIPSNGFGMTWAAQTLPLSAGQRVVVIEDEYPSTLNPFLVRARAVGAEVTRVHCRPDQSWTEAIDAALERTVAIAVVPRVHWVDGRLFDLPYLAERARAHGARLVVDASQSVGVLPLEAAELGASVVTSVAYKWLLGPYGMAYLFVSPELQDAPPLDFAWGSLEGDSLVYPRGARRFDHGESDGPLAIAHATTGIEAVVSWTPSAIAAALAPLTQAIAERARAAGFLVPADHAPHIVGLRRPSGWPADIESRLRAERVYVAHRRGVLRVSPYVYNSLDDVDALFSALRRAV